MDTPLDEQWNADFYGRITLSVVFKMEGELTNLLLHGEESLGYAIFGGRQL